MKNNILIFTVFLSGFSIMVLEILGTRILSPFFGTTTDVLTSIISVVLLALSIGYWIGGRFADKKSTYKNLFLILYFASLITILFFSFTKEILTYITQEKFIEKIAVFIGSVIFFGPVNILLGMVSPYVIRLKTSQINQSGSVSGSIYAIGTIGSIVGTVLTGFVLIPIMGIDTIIYFVGLILFVNSLFLIKKSISKFFVMIFIIIFAILTVIFFRDKTNNRLLIDFDSRYQRISVKQTDFERTLLSNYRCCQSGMDLRKPNLLVFEYTKFFNLGKLILPTAKKYLMIGGGGYSFPKYLLSADDRSTIDVIELDPKITEIAKKYFNLKVDKRLNIIHMDGRIYLNNNIKKYDIIIIDAFSNKIKPFHLTTKETLEKIYNGLNENGLVIVNMVSSLDGKSSLLFKSEYLTYKSVFPLVYIFPIKDKNDMKKMQNIILLAVKNKNFKLPESNDKNSELKKYLSHLVEVDVKEGIILTDNYAPVENIFMR